jgi:NADPH-dependent 2,4-dienoyl-CoA reductase/sulfur reductase-like enzyme
VEGKRVVVGGTGPLLRAAAAGLRKLGARVVGIAELAPAGRVARFGLRLATHPGKLAQAASLSAQLLGVPVWSRALVRRAHGEGSVTAATIDVGGRTRTVECDLIAVGFGLVPSIELPLMFGCAADGGRVVVDEHGATSVAGVRCAGEATGIGGIDKALVEGEIAGLAAAGHAPPARLLRKRRAGVPRPSRRASRRRATGRASSTTTRSCAAARTCGGARCATPPMSARPSSTRARGWAPARAGSAARRWRCCAAFRMERSARRWHRCGSRH